ncbi:MAG TPA: zf-HC2 domain-containing protein [Blastocatellia bacterium]
MFSGHVEKLLSAYCNRELTDVQSNRVRKHLLECSRCRAEYEQIRIGAGLAGTLATVDTPDRLWEAIERSLETGPGVSKTGRCRLAFMSSPIPVGLVAAIVIVGLFCAVIVYVRGNRPSSWKVDSLSGTTLIESEPITAGGKLKVGESIETDHDSRARIYPGRIGEVEIEPESRLRLLQSKDNEYRLSLEHGEVKARISAPPRLFFVDTPSAVAVDLGCAYTLDVDQEGNGRIDVTEGWVEMDSTGGVKTMVPAEAACITRPGVKPGTPFFEDAPRALKDALSWLDFDASSPAGRESALSTVLSESRKRDSLTLWHLLSRVEPQDRARVYARLAELVPPPEGVTSNGVQQLDPDMLDEWFAYVVRAWFD